MKPIFNEKTNERTNKQKINIPERTTDRNSLANVLNAGKEACVSEEATITRETKDINVFM